MLIISTLALLPSSIILKGIPLPSALPVLHWQFKAGTEEQQEFLWTTSVLFGERTLKARPRALISGPGKCFSFQPETGSTSMNCSVLQMKITRSWGSDPFVFPPLLSSMWGRKKERSETQCLAAWFSQCWSFSSSNYQQRFNIKTPTLWNLIFFLYFVLYIH